MGESGRKSGYHTGGSPSYLLLPFSSGQLPSLGEYLGQVVKNGSRDKGRPREGTFWEATTFGRSFSNLQRGVKD